LAEGGDGWTLSIRSAKERNFQGKKREGGRLRSRITRKEGGRVQIIFPSDEKEKETNSIWPVIPERGSYEDRKPITGKEKKARFPTISSLYFY